MSDAMNRLSRRGMLGGVAGAGLATIVGASPASASTTGALDGQRFGMALRVTRTVAQFPVEFTGLLEKTPALTRASAARLRRSARKLTRQHLTLVNTAADDLVADGLLRRGPEDLVAAIGERAARDGLGAPLASLIALSVATLAPPNDPNDTKGSAQTWLGTLARMHSQGTLTDAVARRGIR